jgi:hypothetical protein
VGTDWIDAAATLAVVIELIESSELENTVLSDGNDYGSIRATIRRGRFDGPAADGYNVRAYIVRGNNIYEMTLRKRPGN